jgi:HEAT repeat protein
VPAAALQAGSDEGTTMDTRWLRQLSSPDETERRTAAEHLAGCEDDEALEALCNALADPVPVVCEAAAGSLIAIGGLEVCHRALALLRSDEPRLRSYAVEILEQVADADLDALIALLKDDNHDARACALEVLEFLVEGGDEDTFEPLVEALADENINVAAAAAAALGRLGNPEAIPSLVQQLGRESWMQCNVVGAISEIGGPRAAEALEHLDDSGLTDEARFYLKTALRALHAQTERSG